MARDPISQAALDYLHTTYGIPEADVWRVTVEAGRDTFTEITIKMIIPDSLPTQEEAAPAPKRHPALAAAHAAQFTKGAQKGHADGFRGTTAIVPLVPTVCQRPDPSGEGVCGEVIRWTEANGWHHVSDRHLGVATHSPLPPPVAPGVPTSAVRRTVER